MKSLETHLGVRLFRRLNRRVELTEAGAAFLPAARTALDVVEASAARLSTATRQGPLVVSCLPTFMMRWLIPRLYDFNARHPAIDVRLSASSAPVDFARDGVDVAIRIGAGPWPEGIEAHAFMNEEIGPVCSPALAQRRKLRRPADLGQQTLLHTETRADAWPDWLARSRTATIDASKGQRFEHFYFLLEAAVAGLGVAVAPRPLVMEDLKLGRLVAPFGFVRSGRQYCRSIPRSSRAWRRSAPSARGSTRPAAASVDGILDRSTILTDNNHGYLRLSLREEQRLSRLSRSMRHAFDATTGQLSNILNDLDKILKQP